MSRDCAYVISDVPDATSKQTTVTYQQWATKSQFFYYIILIQLTDFTSKTYNYIDILQYTNFIEFPRNRSTAKCKIVVGKSIFTKFKAQLYKCGKVTAY